MSIRRALICPKCQRENFQDARFCTQCGEDFTPFNRRGFIIALGLTAVPLVITPLLLAPGFFDDVGVGYEGLFFLIFMIFFMVGYSVISAIVSAILFRWRRTRSAGRGVLIGLGAGLILGIASFIASSAAFS